jgi:hypothetical protein
MFTSEQIAAAEQQIFEHSKRIEFYLTEYSIELLASKMQAREFEIPPYQREDTWEPERKSRFIESLLMGLPITFLFFWESPATGKLEIVDGSQRLRTIEQFVLGDMVLKELEDLTCLEGMSFRDLPESRQRKIRNRSIRGIVLNEHADEQARFDLFDRINTGSKIANKAEVRRGALVGPFLDLVVDLARDKLFGKLAPVPEKQAQLREREELVTRFFAYGDGLEGYPDRVSPFLFAYAKKMKEDAQFARAVDQLGTFAEYVNTVYLTCTPAFAAEYLDRNAESRGVKRWDPFVLARKLESGGVGVLIVERDEVFEVMPPLIREPSEARVADVLRELSDARRIN